MNTLNAPSHTFSNNTSLVRHLEAAIYFTVICTKYTTPFRQAYQVSMNRTETAEEELVSDVHCIYYLAFVLSEE
jgi:hypothetical protein